VRILHFDCFSGAAGDMILGALIDAGLPFEGLQRALGSLALDREAVRTERVVRAGIGATKLHVRGEEAAHHHAHQEPHGHRRAGSAGDAAVAEARHVHTHRTLPEIARLIDGSALSPSARKRAVALFERLAETEAAVHGTTRERVHLHELGALDSIVDVVGTVYALEALGIDRVTASPLNVGGGTVATAHGIYPVPAPATARLLTGVPVYAGGQQAELVTPTGALLITAYAERFGALPPMRLERVGYGAGTRDFPDAPNVLRVLIGEAEETAPVRTVVVIETEIDDMNPQIFGVLVERLLAAGALDVFHTPIQMKKARPGTLLTVVATPETRAELTAIIFRESTTIGVRYAEMARECLDRESVTVETPFGPVPIKVARRNGELMNASPEFDACVRIAASSGRPVKDVHAAAVSAFLARSRESEA